MLHSFLSVPLAFLNLTCTQREIVSVTELGTPWQTRKRIEKSTCWVRCPIQSCGDRSISTLIAKEESVIHGSWNIRTTSSADTCTSALEGYASRQGNVMLKYRSQCLPHRHVWRPRSLRAYSLGTVMKPVDGSTAAAEMRDWLAVVLDDGTIHAPHDDPSSLDNRLGWVT